MAWFGLIGNDKQMAATRYAGRQSATDRARAKQAERGSMGKPHRSVRDAANAGESFRTGTPTPRRRRGPAR
jgi:hypothetical protein